MSRSMDARVAATTVGVDVGGTFTDFVFLFPDGSVSVRKHPTTPLDPSSGVLAGLASAKTEGILDGGFALAHGTTVATNALLERRGVRTGLITTEGFRDVLEIGRQARQAIYALDPGRPAPLLPRERRFEVKERIDWQGAVIEPLSEADARSALERLASEQVESVAVCFLFAHLNGRHERRVAEIAREFDFAVSLSSEVAPEPREYERTATVVANAYVAPILRRYLLRLDEAVRAAGAARLRVMQSNGGALSPRDAGEHAIKTALSGPAGGVIAAARIGSDAGLDRLLTFDMGGTSTDVALVVGGKCPVVTMSTLGGIPLRTPMLDIHTVGAGGGSQAWIDSAGALRVGPQSAGADPGPAAYGASSVLTVTDANILLGRMPSDVRLAGSVQLDVARVHACFADLSAKIGRSPESLALGIVAIAEASMARALHHISIERGHDPADFALLSFGGAGGLHACALASALSIGGVLVPRFPGALSALGLAIAPIQHEFSRAIPATCVSEPSGEAVWSRLAEMAAALEADANAGAATEEVEGVAFRHETFLDLRYAGQSFDLRVPFDPAEPWAATAVFHSLHRARYGHADMSEPVEVVAIRCVLTGTMPLPRLRFPAATVAGAPAAEARVHDGSRWTVASRFERDELAIGQTIAGPSLVIQPDAATFLPPGWQGVVDAYSNLRLSPN